MVEFKTYSRSLVMLNKFILTEDPIGNRLKKQICMVTNFDLITTLVNYTSAYSDKMSKRKFNKCLSTLVKLEHVNIYNVEPWIQEYCDKWGHSFESQVQKFKKGKGQIWEYYILEQYIKYLELKYFYTPRTEYLISQLLSVLGSM